MHYQTAKEEVQSGVQFYTAFFGTPCFGGSLKQCPSRGDSDYAPLSCFAWHSPLTGTLGASLNRVVAERAHPPHTRLQDREASVFLIALLITSLGGTKRMYAAIFGYRRGATLGLEQRQIETNTGTQGREASIRGTQADLSEEMPPTCHGRGDDESYTLTHRHTNSGKRMTGTACG